MERNEILQVIEKLWRESPENRLAEELALRPELAGMQIFEAPLVGFGSAADPLFEEYKKPASSPKGR